MILLFAIILGIICFDQLTKWLAVIYLQGNPSFPIWQDVFHFTYAENRGMAFGLLADHRWVFMVLSTLALAILLIYLIRVRPQNPWLRVSLAMVVGGGLGNMIDRIFLGSVIDFLDFTLIDFPIFNVADSFVCVGAGMLIAYLFWDMIREWKKEKKNTTESENVSETESNDDATGME